MNDELKKKFEIMSFFDQARWSIIDEEKNNNYYGINACDDFNKNVENNEEKVERNILLHWITYIAERGSDFRPIWDKGSYVYSNYLKDYLDNDNAKLEEIFKIGGKYLKKIDPKKKKKDDEEAETISSEYKWTAEREGDNKRLEKYFSDDNDNNQVEYISRYYKADYASTVLTLSALDNDKYNKSLLNYLKTIADIIENNFKKGKFKSISKEEAIVKGLAMGLYCLTYSELSFEDVKKYNFTGIPNKKNNKYISLEEWNNILFKKNGGCEKHNNNLKEIMKEDNFAEVFIKFCEGKQFDGLKRVWCALRDYIKDERYKCVFTEKVFADINPKPKPDELVKYLELPGDVWNNNSIFSNCIIKKEYLKIKKDHNTQFYKKNTNNNKFTLNRLLRMLWNKNQEELSKCYPEQFDCTFDFVPKMCDSISDNCKFCPFSQYSNDKQNKINKQKFTNNFNQLCVCDENKNCTIAMICCGYKAKCQGKECGLRKIIEIN